MDGRAISHEVLEHLRFSAINLHEKNISADDIADSFKVTRQAVYRWLRKEKQDGKRSLKSTKAPGPDFLLTERQLKKLLSLLRKPASELGYSTDLWIQLHKRSKTVIEINHLQKSVFFALTYVVHVFQCRYIYQ